MRLILAYIFLSFLVVATSCSRKGSQGSDIGAGHEITYAPRVPLTDSVQSLIKKHNTAWLKSWARSGTAPDLSQFTKDTCFRCADIKRDTLPGDNSFLNSSGRLVYYSPDSTKYIGIQSLGGIQKGFQRNIAPNTEAYLIDLKRRWRYTLSFPGGTDGYSDALWLDNNSFLLLGWRQSWDSLRNKFTPNYLPHIELFDIGLQMKCIYHYKGNQNRD
jgi:hypothetical protein